MQARRYVDGQGRIVYELHGALFFASVHNFQQLFTPHEDTADTLIDFRYSRLYDHSALEAVSALTTRYAALEKRLRLANLSPECRRLLQRAEGAVHVEISSSPHQHIAPEHIGAQDIKP
jgi:SulP family sulfate permease